MLNFGEYITIKAVKPYSLFFGWLGWVRWLFNNYIMRSKYWYTTNTNPNKPNFIYVDSYKENNEIIYVGANDKEDSMRVEKTIGVWNIKHK